MILAENVVVTAIIEEIESQLIGQGIDERYLQVSQSFQPTEQQVGTREYKVFLSPITTTNINVERINKVTTVDDVSTITTDYCHAEGLVYQIECLVGSGAEVNALQLLNLIKRLLQHYDAITNLKAKGVFVQNCGAVRPSYTILDRGVYESNPNFDFTVNYSSKYSKAVNRISYITEDTGRV